MRREGTPEAAPEAVRQAVGGGGQSGWRLQMPLKLALGVRGTVAGHRLGALEGGGWVPPPPLPMHPPPPPPPAIVPCASSPSAPDWPVPCACAPVQVEGIEPDLITWNYIVAVSAKTGNWRQAWDFMEDMRLMGVSPNVETYNGLLKGFFRPGFWQEAWEVRALGPGEGGQGLLVDRLGGMPEGALGGQS